MPKIISYTYIALYTKYFVPLPHSYHFLSNLGVGLSITTSRFILPQALDLQDEIPEKEGVEKNVRKTSGNGLIPTRLGGWLRARTTCTHVNDRGGCANCGGQGSENGRTRNTARREKQDTTDATLLNRDGMMGRMIDEGRGEKQREKLRRR